MRMVLTRAACACALVALAVSAVSEPAIAQSSSKKQSAKGAEQGDLGIIQIPANANFPVSRKITLGVGKSQMLQFPMDLRDVMIADPTKVDALVQTSDRVFLIAKQAGSTNAFFFDAQGQQIMNLEIAIGSDLSGLNDLLKRLIPSSNINSELAGSAIVLTGSVRTPIDATRAVDLATQFAAANQNLIGSTRSSSWTQTAGGGWSYQSSSADSGRAVTFDPSQREKRIINMLAIEGEDQVMLKVTVAEVQRSVLKQFGINIANTLSIGKFAFDQATMNSLPITGSTLGGLPNVGLATADAISKAAKAGETISKCATILPQVHPSYVGHSGLNAGWSSGNSCFNAVMKAMERHGLVRTLAEPTLTAVSGESAKFLAGGEYPVPISADNGSVGISFKEFGVGVAFSPVVLSEGRISLKIDTEVSELSNEGAIVMSGIQIPSLRKRQARSTVELPSGGSLAMAGLISETTRQSIEGLPGAKDIPILGTLFRSRDFQKAETELVIIVTPYVVRPTSRQNLARPDEGLAPASDMKANFLGHINRVYGKGRQAPANGGLKGDHGFIVD
jgi:pilus assembly protein CpaC